MRIRLLSVVLLTILLTPGAVSATQVSAAQVTIDAPTAGAYISGGDPDPYPLAAAVSGGEAASVEFFRCDDASSGCATGTWVSLGADAAAPYTAAWPVDTDGNRALRAVATDTADPPGTSEHVINVTVDRTGPEGALTAPAANAWVTGEVTVSAAVGDAGSGVSSVTFQQRAAGTTAWTPISTDTDAPWSATWDTSGLADGDYQLRVVSTDAAGNSAPSPFRTVGIDRTPPNGTSVSYPHGYDPDGTVLVTTNDGTDAGSGLDPSSKALERRTAQLAGGDCGAFGDWAPATTPDALDSGTCAQYRYSIADNLGHRSLATNPNVVKVDLTPPTVAVLAPVILSGPAKHHFDPGNDTLWFRPEGQGSFRLRATVTDAESGDERATFPNLDAVLGWTGTGGADLSGPSPYSSLEYAWTNGAASPNERLVTGRDGAGLTTTAAITINADAAPPTGGSIAYATGYHATGTVTVATEAGNDSGSGLDPAGSVLQRQTAPLAGGVCGAFGAWAVVPATNTVASGFCAQYRYVVTDNVGNTAIFGPEGTVRVDQSAPAAPALEVTENEPDEHVVGTTLYYNPSGANVGTFTVEATAADAQSGVEHVAFPTVFGSDATVDAVAPYTHAYSWNAADSASGPRTVSVQNGAGDETSATFTITPDNDKPTGGTISYPDGYDGDGSVTVTVTDGTDAGSGIASRVLERRTAPLTGGSCGTYAPWAAVASTNTVASGLCAQYRHRVTDHVGNEAQYESQDTVKVDKDPPSAPTLALIESSPFAAVSGREIFVNTDVTGSYTVSATTEDAASGIAKVRFPSTGDDVSAPYEQEYEFDDLVGPQPVTAFDGANRTSSTIFEVTPDTAPPAGGSVSYPDGYDADGEITVVTANGADALAGVDGNSGVLEQDTAPLSGAECATFPGSWTEVAKAHALAPNTCARYRYRVSDRVGNEVGYSSTHVVRFDTVAPGEVTGASATAADHAVTLRWTPPTDPDLAGVRILRSRAGAAPVQIYFGGATSFKDTAVTNGVTYTYTLSGRDSAGNLSTGVARAATPRSLYLVSPRDGAVLTRPPLLDWRPKTGATYYNVQLWRSGVKILTRWPTRSQFQLGSRWTQNGRVFRLSAGQYRWLVWPGFGKPAAARYGKLLGWSEFRIR
jgi:Bacterial Ig domain